MDTPTHSVKHERDVLIGQMIAERLYQAGIHHIFGVPGDFSLSFLECVLQSRIKFIGCCNELNAAYAADAYARIKGIGCLSTTYAVGELSAINGVAGSWAEGFPVVKVVSGPPSQHWDAVTLLHHTLGDYRIPLSIYSNITCAQALINTPDKALTEVDRVLTTTLEKKKPGYITICSDMIFSPCAAPEYEFVHPKEKVSDQATLHESVLEILQRLNDSRRPMAIAGSELRVRQLADAAKSFIVAARIPYATMMLGKTVIEEEHPNHIGLYTGNRSRPYVLERVENADCLIVMGEKMTDFNTGGFSAALDPKFAIYINYDHVKIGHHVYHNVYIHDVIRALTELVAPRTEAEKIKCASDGCTHRRSMEFTTIPDKPLTMGRLFDRISSFIPQNAIVIADTGSSLFSAAEVLMPKGVHFIGQTFYGSIGYSIGATLGACIAAPERPVILFVGDGSLQVTVQDISTMIRNNCNVVIFVVNNDGYTIERVIHDNTYNDIQMWQYSNLPVVFGGRAGVKVATEGQLQSALERVDFARGGVQLIELVLDRWDCNDALKRAGQGMAQINKLDAIPFEDAFSKVPRLSHDSEKKH